MLNKQTNKQTNKQKNKKEMYQAHEELGFQRADYPAALTQGE